MPLSQGFLDPLMAVIVRTCRGCVFHVRGNEDNPSTRWRGSYVFVTFFGCLHGLMVGAGQCRGRRHWSGRQRRDFYEAQMHGRFTGRNGRQRRRTCAASSRVPNSVMALDAANFLRSDGGAGGRRPETGIAGENTMPKAHCRITRRPIHRDERGRLPQTRARSPPRRGSHEGDSCPFSNRALGQRVQRRENRARRLRVFKFRTRRSASGETARQPTPALRAWRRDGYPYFREMKPGAQPPARSSVPPSGVRHRGGDMHGRTGRLHLPRSSARARPVTLGHRGKFNLKQAVTSRHLPPKYGRRPVRTRAGNQGWAR